MTSCMSWGGARRILWPHVRLAVGRGWPHGRLPTFRISRFFSRASRKAKKRWLFSWSGRRNSWHLRGQPPTNVRSRPMQSDVHARGQRGSAGATLRSGHQRHSRELVATMQAARASPPSSWPAPVQVPAWGGVQLLGGLAVQACNMRTAHCCCIIG